MIKRQPVASSQHPIFSGSHQEQLSQKAIARAKVFASRREFGDAAAVLAGALDRISEPQVYKTLAISAARLLADSAELLFREARKKNSLVKVSLEQAIMCYEVAVHYYTDITAIKDVATCYLRMAEIRRELLLKKLATKDDFHCDHLIAEAKAALIYYIHIDDKKMITKLNSLIVEFTGKDQDKEYPPIYYTILSNAEKVFDTFSQDPNKVTTVTLITTQIRLERIVAELSETDVNMKMLCHKALLKTHFTYAMCTKNYETAREHLSSALEYLHLVMLGTTEQSQPLLNAAAHHMSARVLLKFDQTESDALSLLAQAYAIYKQYDRKEGMEAITRLAPSISEDVDHSSYGM